MIKNLTGGAAISYGATLPDATTAFDGSLFYKTSGADQGLYIFSFNQDGNTVIVGDQVTQNWTQVTSPSLYVSKAGDVMNGSLGITGGNSTNDPYGRVSVTLPADTNNYGYFGLTRQGMVGWSLGIDTTNRFFIGLGGPGTLNNVTNRLFQFMPDGNILISGNPVWHTGNDGLGSGLDAGLLGGQAPSFYQDATNMTSGSLPAARLPYVAVRQGGTSTLTLSWAGPQLALQVDATNFSTTWPINISGVAATATSAATAADSTRAVDAQSSRYLRQGATATGTNMIFNWQLEPGQPSRVWGGNNGIDMHGYNPSNFSVNYATTAGSANSVAWTNVSGRPTSLSQFTEDAGYLRNFANSWVKTSDDAERFLFTTGSTTYGPGITHNHIFRGNIYTNGFVYADGNVTAFSDRRLKTNIAAIPDALEKVKQLTGVTFNRISDDSRGTGLIAQDVHVVLPEAVQPDPESGMLSVAYGNLVGLLVESIKELSGQVEALKLDIEKLKGQ